MRLRSSLAPLGGLALALALALASRTVRASPPAAGPGAVDASEHTPLIAHGEPVVSCGWPTVVAVTSGSQCTGTLIHPRVVVYAAHCGGGLKTIRFGEDAWAGGRTVAVESCRSYPGYAGAEDQGHDWAYCLLAEPVEDLPVAPPLYGCERERLSVGEEVAIVGFGQTIEEPSGLKRWAATTLAAVTPGNNTSLVGNPNVGQTPSFCAGDSGGPGLIQLEDGSWRTFGIASTVAGECGGYGAHSLLAGAVPWIEADSGVDVTPCHASDGSWAPSPACAGAYAQPINLGAGSWPDWCAGTAAVGPSTSCGPAWDQLDPTALPSVAISSPSTGESFLEGAEVEVEIAAARDPEGFAVAHVSLAIDGEIVAVDDNDPWLFAGPPFPGPGVYSLVAIAEDWAGNQVESEPATIGWGEEISDPDGGNETSSEETGDERSGEGDADGGSRCTVTDPYASTGTGWTIALAMLGFGRTLTRRRRRLLNFR